MIKPDKRLKLIGVKKGMMTVIGAAPDKGNRPAFVCQCECGKTRIIQAKEFHRSRTQYNKCICDIESTLKYRHHPLYEVWKGMKARCRDPKHIAYKNYGARGIKVCDRWKQFTKFFSDVKKGYKRGLQLDRINAEGNYEPNNFQWLTPKLNAQKSRQSKLSVEKAKYIRNSDLSNKELSIKYGVTIACINQVKNYRTWI